MKKRKLYLSYTSIKTFLNCKQRFKYKHIDKIDSGEAVSSKYMSFGNSIHMALADFNRITDKEYRTLQVLHNLLRKNWKRDGYESEEEEKEFGLRGLGMLTSYLKDPQDLGIKNLIIEDMVFDERDDFILCGKLDKVYIREENQVEILDYKTSKSIAPIDRLQLPIYLMLANAKLGFYPSHVSYYYLSQNEKILQEVSKELLNKSTHYIRKVCEHICKEQDYSANPNCYCHMNCEYYNMCDAAKDSNLMIINSLKNLQDDQLNPALF